MSREQQLKLLKNKAENLGAILTLNEKMISSDLQMLDVLWFHGVPASITKDGATIEIVASGEVSASLLDENGNEVCHAYTNGRGNTFAEDIKEYVHNDDELNQLRNSGRLVFSLNNWFEAVGTAEGHSECFDLGDVLDDDLFEAIDQVLDDLPGMVARIREQSEKREKIMSTLHQAIDKAFAATFPYQKKQADGYYHVVLDTDYRDEMSDDIANEILTAGEHPYDAFYDKMFEWYSEAEWEEETHILESVKQYFAKHYPELADEDDYVLREALRDIVSIDLPEDHFLNQEFPVNIFIDTGDGNYDYVLNAVYPHYNGTPQETIDDKASIVWLAQRQGYSKMDLNNALRKQQWEGKFLPSVYRELLNHSTHMCVLTLLVKMKLKELIGLNMMIRAQEINGHCYDATKRPNCGRLSVSQYVTCGLYDPWNGGGSLLEIELEKDFVLPVRYIRSALVDGGDGYSIRSCYGCTSSIYNNSKRMKPVIPIYMNKEYRRYFA